MTTPADTWRTFLETLTPETLGDIGRHVTEDVHFKDPFNDVVGQDRLEAIFRHMFRTVGPVKFTVHACASDGLTSLMQWTFSARLKGKPWSFEGTSKVTFTTEGKVMEHIDYWDAAENLYEGNIPLIGWLLSRIRLRLGTAAQGH